MQKTTNTHSKVLATAETFVTIEWRSHYCNSEKIVVLRSEKPGKSILVRYILRRETTCNFSLEF